MELSSSKFKRSNSLHNIIFNIMWNEKWIKGEDYP
jgi:hypothetical protein